MQIHAVLLYSRVIAAKPLFNQICAYLIPQIGCLTFLIRRLAFSINMTECILIYNDRNTLRTWLLPSVLLSARHQEIISLSGIPGKLELASTDLL